MRRICFAVLMAMAAMVEIQPTYAQQEVLWDGFEGQMKWEPVQWQNVGQVIRQWYLNKIK